MASRHDRGALLERCSDAGVVAATLWLSREEPTAFWHVRCIVALHGKETIQQQRAEGYGDEASNEEANDEEEAQRTA